VDAGVAQLAGSPFKRQLSGRGSVTNRGSVTRRRHHSNSESEENTEKQSSTKRQASGLFKKGKSTEVEPETVNKVLTKEEKEEMWDKDIPEVWKLDY